MELFNIFTNREIAIFIWLVIFFIWAFSKKGVWSSMKEPLWSIVKQLFWGKIGFAFLLATSYIISVVFLLYKINYWDIYLLKDTIFWFLGSAFVLFINVNKATSEEHYFKKIILDSIKFVAIFEFIVNLYVFNIFIELIIVPIVIFVAAMVAFAGNKPEYILVKKILNVFLAVFGLISIFYALGQVVTHFTDFATLDNLKDFLLTPILTVAYLPFLYFLVLVMTYEFLFVRISLWVKDKNLLNYTRWRIFKKCFLSLNKLIVFSRDSNLKLMSIRNKSDVNNLFSKSEVSK